MTEPADTTVRRSYQIYLYSVCFVTILVVAFGAAEAIYGLVRIIAPGTTGASSFFSSDLGARIASASGAERRLGVAQLLQDGLIALAAFGVFRFHWNQAIILRAELEAATAPVPPAPERSPFAPPAEEPAAPAPDIVPAPRKRAPRKR